MSAPVKENTQQKPSSQESAFSLRIVSVDYVTANPIHGLDPTYSNFMGEAVRLIENCNFDPAGNTGTTAAHNWKYTCRAESLFVFTSGFPILACTIW